MADQVSLAPLQALSAALSDAVTQASPSIVSVHSHHARSTGFVWRPGLIVTADEALAEEGEISIVQPGGASVRATPAGRDPTTDIALLRADTQQPAVTWTANPVAVGSLAIVVGAQDGSATAALGAVSLSGANWRSLRGGLIEARIELDLTLRRAAEGGLALDPSGRAFGMAVFGPRRRVLVIPAATIDRVAAKLETAGRIPRGYLGLGLQPVKLDDTGIGAMVMSIDGKGPGAAAGVRQGDVITSFDGQPIRSVHTLVRALGPDSVGSVVRLALRRAGEPTEATLTIGERP
jgi:S1-C subfamily serine protease